MKLYPGGNFNWVKRIGSAGIDRGYGINVDILGNISTTGTFSQTANFNTSAGIINLTSNGLQDVFVHKMDEVSNFLWAKSFGGLNSETTSSVVTDSIGDIYIAGGFSGSVDFDPSTNVFNMLGPNTNLFIEKLAADGTFLWAKNFGGNGTDFGQDMHIDKLNNLYCLGMFNNTVVYDTETGYQNIGSYGDDIFISKLNQCNPNYSVDFQFACDSFVWVDNNTYYLSTSTPVHTIVGGAANGCDSIITLNLTIGDNLAPVADIAILSDVIVDCEITSFIAPTATDNCAGALIGTHDATLPITAQGTTVVTWTYDDGNGNTTTQTQNVVIDDVTDPVTDVATLADVTAECEVSSLTAPTATDNCTGALTGTHDATLPITTQGTTVVTWTYDDGNGNTATQTQNVIITPIDNGVTQVDGVTLSADAIGYSYQWLDCNNGNQAINGATNQTYIASSNGNYAVEIDNGTCTVTSNCMVINQVGISEIGDTELVEIYPNPTHGEVTINLGKSFLKTTIILIDLNGKTVFQETYNNMEKIHASLMNLESGMYYLNVISEGINEIVKVVKQ